MLSRSRYVDIQSKHVKSHLSDFVNTEDKIFFIKSDILIYVFNQIIMAKKDFETIVLEKLGLLDVLVEDVS